MRYVIQMLDGYPLQLVIVACLFANFFPRRSRFALRFTLFLLPLMVVYNIGLRAIPAIHVPVLDRALLAIPGMYVILGIWFCFECKFLDAVYCVSSAHPAQNIVFNLYWIAKLRFGFEEGTPEALLFSLPLMAVVYALVYLVFARRMREWDDYAFIRRKLEVNGFIVLILLIFLCPRAPGTPNETLVYISYIAADVLALIMQFGLFNESIMERRNAITEQLLYAEQKKQRMAEENVELINRKCHDLKHQIEGIRRMTSQQEREMVIGQIEHAVMMYETAMRTGNETVDLILMDKLLYCQEHHIQLTFVGDGSKLQFMDTMDIYALFGNALDNAIEHVIQEPDPARRVISFRVGCIGNIVGIHFENYLSHPVQFKDGQPVTEKPDRQYHGFGSLSMKRIAEKYQGNLRFSAEDGVFSVDIMIPVM